MKAMGIALALTLALVGCQGNQGGGGGTATPNKSQAQQDKGLQAKVPGMNDTERIAKQTHDHLRDATKNASEARSDVAKKKWDSAKDNMDEVQDKLASLSKEATPEVQRSLAEVEKLADKAEASIKSHATTAKQDLDKLVARLNKVSTREIKAGGGKPAEK